MRRMSDHLTLSAADPLLGEYAMTLRRPDEEDVVLYSEPGDLDMGCVNESSQPNVTFVEVDVDVGDGLAAVLACVALRNIRVGEFLTTDFGESFDGVRAARGYTNDSELRRRPAEFSQPELLVALRCAFGSSQHMSRILVGVGGAISVREDADDGDSDYSPGRARATRTRRPRPARRRAATSALSSSGQSTQ